MKMTPRERVMASVNHQNPDSLPMDLGSNVSAGISGMAYGKLKEYLMLPLLALLFGSILMNKHKYVNCCLKNLMQYLLENQMVWSYVKSILI